MDKKENKRLKRIINDLERSCMLQEELLKGNVLYLNNYDSKEEFRVIKTNEALQKIKEAIKNNSATIVEKEGEVYSLNCKLRDYEDMYKKNVEQKKLLYTACVLFCLWSTYITLNSIFHFFK